MTLITESREICEFENEESVNTTCSSTTPMLGRARMVGGGGPSQVYPPCRSC